MKALQCCSPYQRCNTMCGYVFFKFNSVIIAPCMSFEIVKKIWKTSFKAIIIIVSSSIKIQIIIILISFVAGAFLNFERKFVNSCPYLNFTVIGSNFLIFIVGVEFLMSVAFREF